MPNKIERRTGVTDLTLASTAASTPLIPYSAVAGGMVFFKSVLSGSPTKVVWYAQASDKNGQPLPVRSAVGSVVETPVVAGNAYQIPDECFAAPFLKAVLDNGTAEAYVSVKG